MCNGNLQPTCLHSEEEPRCYCGDATAGGESHNRNNRGRHTFGRLALGFTFRKTHFHSRLGNQNTYVVSRICAGALVEHALNSSVISRTLGIPSRRRAGKFRGRSLRD
jgi:hypothetical protein